MENFINHLKSVPSLLNTTFIRLYLLIFYILNAIYLTAELYKFRLRELFLSNEEQNKIYFTEILNLSNITTTLESLIFIINLTFLIASLIKDRYRIQQSINITKYFITNVICVCSIIIMGLILSALFSVSAGNLFQQVIYIFFITVILLVRFIIITAYKFLISKTMT
ncbi:MAG: hypothetical protein K0S30_1249 [Clostridia bacterium]|jgi:hypothetical protein|nr:hypothetical protein [Clostridia bacterium]